MGTEQQVLEHIAQLVLEQAAFAIVEPPGDDWSEPELAAELGFLGPRRGRVRLAATQALAEELAASMLGLDPGDSEARDSGQQALAELVNILAGALMVELFGPRAVCSLSIPEVRAARREPPDAAAQAVARFRVDPGHPLEVALYLEDRR